MTFKDLPLKESYDTGNENPLEDFYVPVLKEAIQYDRIAGFFSSSSLAVAARGIGGLIANNGHMRIIASPILSKEDADVFADVTCDPEKYLIPSLLSQLDDLEQTLMTDHLQALGWMIANHYLSIKLALILDENDHIGKTDGLFHQKVGILRDSAGNALSFSGSINETAFGWLENIEEFKVFKSWEVGQKRYFDSDVQKFEDYWNNRRTGVKVIDLPEAVRSRLIEIGKRFNKDKFCMQKYLDPNPDQMKKGLPLNLFWYQQEAHDQWIANDYRMLFEMATGTGKTRTAIACVNTLLQLHEKLVVVIACPQTTLSRQWFGEIEKLGLKFDNSIVADGTNAKWRAELNKALLEIKVGYNSTLVVYTTHQTASSSDFIQLVCSYNKIKFCFVGDEVHGLGAYKTRHALLPEYTYRIGLSATPKRWFDEYGTKLIEDFFGNCSYEFTIRDALREINPMTGKTFLVQYEYHPIILHLTKEELEEYAELSGKVIKLSRLSRDSDEYQKILEFILFERSRILKKAEEKLSALDELLADPHSKLRRPVEDTLLFVADNQIDDVLRILGNHQIIAHKYTQEEGVKKESRYHGLSEREFLIEKFKDRTYKALVAIKCMDEGIDIPTASTAIIMSSSTNPREYIQRIGRVIRQSEGKIRAWIFDFVIAPDYRLLKDPELIEFEQEIFEKEKIRMRAIATDAINNAEILSKINAL